MHAVYTASPTLVVGGFFHTAATYHLSIDYIRHQLQNSIQDNDHPSQAQWAENAEIMTHAREAGLFDRRQEQLVANSVLNLLSSLNLVEGAARGAPERVRAGQLPGWAKRVKREWDGEFPHDNEYYGEIVRFVRAAEAWYSSVP